jgi:phage shock protein C
MTLFDNRRQGGLYRARDGMIFGVCKGIADHFGFSVFWLRVIVIVAFLLTGIWPVAVLYVLAALIMKPALTTKPASVLTEEQSHPRRLYRSRSGMILGVCKGIAEYFDLSVGWMRILALALLILSGIWPVAILYVLAAFLLKPEPVVPIGSEEAEEFYNSYMTSRSMALRRLKRTFDNLDRRVQHMESIVTGREFDWDRRLHEGS